MSKLHSCLQVTCGTVLVVSMMNFSAYAATVSEGFESGSKGAYAAGNVVLSSGTWNFNDALIGNLSTDRKNGTWSARIINSGKLSMLFDRTTGAGTITIQHAKFGSDANTTWGLWCSTNSGSSYTQIGSPITTNSTNLQTATFTPNLSGTVRCDVRKTDGSSNRVNIDDVVITDYGTGGTGGSSSLPAGSVPFFDNIYPIFRTSQCSIHLFKNYS